MKNNKQLSIDELWALLVDYGLFTEAELRLISYMDGYNIETLNNAIYARFGYRDFEQLLSEMERR